MSKVISLFTVLTLLSLTACGGDVAQWSEEVQLHDGKIVTLKRRSTLGAKFVPGAHRALVESWELCYAPMKAYWRSSAYLQPSHFEIADGVAYIKVPMKGGMDCTFFQNPEGSTIYFALRDGQWQRIPAEQFPDKKRWKNLLKNRIWDGRDKKDDIRGHWTVEAKWEREDYVEDSLNARRMMRDQLKRCSEDTGGRYEGITNEFKVQATPKDSFCE